MHSTVVLFDVGIKNEISTCHGVAKAIKARRVDSLQVQVQARKLRTTRRSTGGAARGAGTPCATSRAWWSSAGWQRTFLREGTESVRQLTIRLHHQPQTVNPLLPTAEKPSLATRGHSTMTARGQGGVASRAS